MAQLQIGIGVVGAASTVAFAYRACREEEEVKQGLYTAGFLTSLALTGLALFTAERYKKIPFDCGSGEPIWIYKYAKKIELAHLPYLTDSHLKELAQFASMETLSLKGCPLITREGLPAVGECRSLTFLEINNCPEISKWGEAAIPDGLIEKLARRYEVGFRRTRTSMAPMPSPHGYRWHPVTIPNKPYPVFRVFVTVEDPEGALTFGRQVTEWH